MELLTLVLSLAIIIVLEILRPVKAQKTIVKEKEVVVERPSFLLESGVLDLDELFVFVITHLHESGGVSQDARVAKSWHTLVQKHLDTSFPVTSWVGIVPSLWVGTKIPDALVEHLESLEKEHQNSVNVILNQEEK